MEPMIKEAMEQEMIFLHNPQLHREYEAREKAVKDRISQIITAKAEGKEEERVRSIKAIMETLHVAASEAMATLKIPEKDWTKYERML